MAARTDRTIRRQRNDFLKALREGLSISGACKRANVPRRTIYEWREADEKFSNAWDDALEEGTDVLEDVAYVRAALGVEEPVFHQGEEVGSVVRYSDRLLQFLLIGRRRQKYRPQTIDIQASGSGHLTVHLAGSDAEL